MSKKLTAEKQAEIEHATKRLREFCTEGKVIYGQLIDSNGQGTRTYTFYTVVEGEIVCLDYYIHTVLGYAFRETSKAARGLSTQDDGYGTVLHLSYHLYGTNYYKEHDTGCAFTYCRL